MLEMSGAIIGSVRGMAKASLNRLRAWLRPTFVPVPGSFEAGGPGGLAWCLGRTARGAGEGTRGLARPAWAAPPSAPTSAVIRNPETISAMGARRRLRACDGRNIRLSPQWKLPAEQAGQRPGPASREGSSLRPRTLSRSVPRLRCYGMGGAARRTSDRGPVPGSSQYTARAAKIARLMYGWMNAITVAAPY